MDARSLHGGDDPFGGPEVRGHHVDTVLRDLEQADGAVVVGDVDLAPPVLGGDALDPLSAVQGGGLELVEERREGPAGILEADVAELDDRRVEHRVLSSHSLLQRAVDQREHAVSGHEVFCCRGAVGAHAAGQLVGVDLLLGIVPVVGAGEHGSEPAREGSDRDSGVGGTETGHDSDAIGPSFRWTRRATLVGHLLRA